MVFEGDYLREHVTLGYAATVHSAQGVTAESSYAILGEETSRAMLYVAMTRGRDNNGRSSTSASPARPTTSTPLRCPASGSPIAARQQIRGRHHFRLILANDNRPRSMHAEAERTERTYTGR